MLTVSLKLEKKFTKVSVPSRGTEIAMHETIKHCVDQYQVPMQCYEQIIVQQLDMVWAARP